MEQEEEEDVNELEQKKRSTKHKRGEDTKGRASKVSSPIHTKLRYVPRGQREGGLLKQNQSVQVPIVLPME